MDDPRSLQLRLEQIQGDLGAIRFRESLERNPTTSGAANSIIARYIEKVAEFLHARRARRGSGRRAACEVVLTALKFEEAAYIAVATVFECIAGAASNRNRAGRPPTFQAVSGRIADRLVEQIKRAQSLEEPAREGTLQAGALLVCALEQIGMLTISPASTGRGVKDVEIQVRLSNEVEERIRDRNEQLALLASWRLPMVVPPIDWTTPFDGGYLTDRRNLVIRPKRVPREQWKKWLQFHQNLEPIANVYTAVNALQRTPWRVNTEVLRVFDALWDRGGGVAKLPARDGSTVRRDSHRSQVVAVSALRETVEVLRREAGLDRSLYFPMELDWRGRVYSVARRLEPQGRDVAKGLLRFSESKPLGSPEAVQWLMRHGANCFGLDKQPFYSREKWVEENSARLVAAANAPFDNVNFWGGARKPFQALAFCLEWGAFIRGGRSLAFPSSLPVAMDGSCNGFQHLAALIRDPAAAEAVNLAPSSCPQDVYQRVVDSIEDQLAELEGESMAREWLESGLLNRSLVKRPVMTIPYGALAHGIAQQLIDAVNEMDASTHFKSLTGAANFLAKQIETSLGRVLHRANEVRVYLNRLATVVGRGGLNLGWWTAPSGFQVFTDYRELKELVVRVPIGRRRKFVYRVATEHSKPDTRKQTAAIVPNLIHSLDAGHLAKTLAACARQRPGMAFATVHDSFATHAADAELLASELRHQFVEIYELKPDDGDFVFPHGRWLEELHERLPGAWVFHGDRKQLPEPPEPGDFDIRAVLDSLYFFS